MQNDVSMMQSCLHYYYYVSLLTRHVIEIDRWGSEPEHYSAHFPILHSGWKTLKKSHFTTLREIPLMSTLFQISICYPKIKVVNVVNLIFELNVTRFLNSKCKKKIRISIFRPEIGQKWEHFWYFYTKNIFQYWRKNSNRYV